MSGGGRVIVAGCCCGDSDGRFGEFSGVEEEDEDAFRRFLSGTGISDGDDADDDIWRREEKRIKKEKKSRKMMVVIFPSMFLIHSVFLPIVYSMLRHVQF